MQGSANSGEFISYKFIWINVYLTPMSTKSSLDRPNRDSGYPGTVRTQSEIHPKIDFLSICQGSYDRLGTVCSSVSCKSQNLFWWNFSKKKMSISSKNRWNRKVFFFSNFRIGLFGVDMIGRPVLRKEKLPVLHRSPTLDFCTSFRWSTLTNLSVWPTLSLNVFAEARYWFQRPFKIVLYSSTKLKLKHV